MNVPLAALCLVSSLLAVLLLLKGGGLGVKRLRVVLHFLSVVGFGTAGWVLAREGDRWGGIGVLGFAFLWIGVFWVLSIRLRLVHPGRSPAKGGVPPAGAAGQTPDDRASESLDSQGEAMLERLTGMARVKVSQIATPREGIVFADCAGGAEEALQRILISGHLRIPMVDGSLDRVVGIVHAKDILSYAVGRRGSPVLKSLMRRPLFVTADRPVGTLLELFRSQRSHLAIVVDVYGRTLGVVTRGDLFRHLTGGARSA